MGDTNIKEIYDIRLKDYTTLGEIILKELNKIQRENKNLNIDFIQFRIKNFNSFYDKTRRFHKKWKNKDPFEENEDFCGLRIIHLLNCDLPGIIKTVYDSFEVIKEFSHTDSRPNSPLEFTYRSHHLIVKLKDKLLINNKHLNKYKAEVQIRTLCMHSWAAIEHKLNYKQQNSLPEGYRSIINRKFSQMSAVLEIADEFFVELNQNKINHIERYKHILIDSKSKNEVLKILNIDSLQAYLEDKFPNIKKESERIRYLLDEMIESKLTLRDIELGIDILKAKGIYKDLILKSPIPSLSQPILARLILDITNNQFYKMRMEKIKFSKWVDFVQEIKNNLK